MVGESSVLSLVSLFAPLTLGLYWKRASAVGALVAMVSGIVTWLIALRMHTDWPPLIPGLLVSLMGMIIGSLVWKDKVVEHGKD